MQYFTALQILSQKDRSSLWITKLYLQSDHGFNVNGILLAFISLVKAERKFSCQAFSACPLPTYLICLPRAFLYHSAWFIVQTGWKMAEPQPQAYLAEVTFLVNDHNASGIYTTAFWKGNKWCSAVKQLFSCIKERWTVAIHFMTIKILLFGVKTSAAFILLDFVIYLALSDCLLETDVESDETDHSLLWDSEGQSSYFLIGRGNEACWSELGSDLYPTQMCLVSWYHRPHSRTICQGSCVSDHRPRKYTVPVLFHLRDGYLNELGKNTN